MLYSITDWHGTVHKMSASSLYLRVMQDSKSDYNWIASATELVRVCKEPRFPSYYARKIKIAILNCFANIELQNNLIGRRLSTDDQAVYYCYYSLPNNDSEAFEVKKKYLKAIITSITLYHYDIMEKLSIPYGPTYKRICDSWINEKFNQNILKEDIVFETLIKELHEDLEKTITSAKKLGVFDKDYEEEKKCREEIAKRIVEACKDL